MKKAGKVLLIIVIVLAVLIGAGFLYLYSNGYSGKVVESGSPEEGQIKVACVGDSITYGHGIKKWEKNNYPALLQRKLGDGYYVRNFGICGSCVQDNADQPYTASDFYAQHKDYNADIVVFMMGSNDSKPENWFGADAFKSSLCSLLDSYGDARIILCTPATCFFMEDSEGTTTSFDLQPVVAAEIAGIVRDVAAERNYVLVDIYALTGENQQWFETDGVHPDNDGAAAIADAVYQAVKGAEKE